MGIKLVNIFILQEAPNKERKREKMRGEGKGGEERAGVCVRARHLFVVVSMPFHFSRLFGQFERERLRHVVTLITRSCGSPPPRPKHESIPAARINNIRDREIDRKTFHTFALLALHVMRDISRCSGRCARYWEKSLSYVAVISFDNDCGWRVRTLLLHWQGKTTHKMPLEFFDESWQINRGKNT